MARGVTSEQRGRAMEIARPDYEIIHQPPKPKEPEDYNGAIRLWFAVGIFSSVVTGPRTFEAFRQSFLTGNVLEFLSALSGTLSTELAMFFIASFIASWILPTLVKEKQREAVNYTVGITFVIIFLTSLFTNTESVSNIGWTWGAKFFIAVAPTFIGAASGFNHGTFAFLKRTVVDTNLRTQSKYEKQFFEWYKLHENEYVKLVRNDQKQEAKENRVNTVATLNDEVDRLIEVQAKLTREEKNSLAYEWLQDAANDHSLGSRTIEAKIKEKYGDGPSHTTIANIRKELYPELYG